MTDRAAVELLDSFDLAGYILEVRSVGRLNLDLQIRQAAADLHRRVVDLNSTSRGELSRVVRVRVDIAQRFLAPEFEFDTQLRERGKIVPRYRWYTNVSALNYVVGFAERQPIGVQLQRSSLAARLIVEDWVGYERDARDGTSTFGLTDTDAGSVARRVVRLEELSAVLPSSSAAEPSPRIPRTFNDLAGERGALDTIKHLVALPLTTCHDEYAFLRTIHLSEVVFRSTLQCVWQARALIAAGDLGPAADCVIAGNSMLALLVPTFRALKTMPEEHFATGFRDATGEASAQQSLAYQHLETLVKSQNDAHKREALGDNAPEVAGVFAYDGAGFLPLAEQVQRMDAHHPDAQRLWDATVELLHLYRGWRLFHEIQFAAKDYIPQGAPGTGGTKGRPYLQQQTFPHHMTPGVGTGILARRPRRPGPAASLTKATRVPMLPVATREL